MSFKELILSDAFVKVECFINEFQTIMNVWSVQLVYVCGHNCNDKSRNLHINSCHEKKAHHTIPWSFVWKTIPITHSLSFYFVNLFQLVFFFICLSFSFSRAHSLSVLFDAIFPLVLNQIMPCVIEFLSIL